MKSLDLGDVEDFPFLDPAARRARSPRATASSRSSAPSGPQQRAHAASASAWRASRVDPRIGRMILAGAEPRLPARGPRRRRGAQRPGPARTTARGAAEGRRPPPSLPRRALRLRGAPAPLGVRPRGREQRDVVSPARLQRELSLVSPRSRVGRRPPPARRRRPRAAARHAPESTAATGDADASAPRAPHRPSVEGRPVEHRAARVRRRQADALRDSPVVVARAQAAAVDHGVRARRDDAALRADGREDRAGVAAQGGAASPQAQLRRPALVGEVGAGRRSASTRRSSGFPSSADRSVDYATVAPAQARLMFLDHALVRGEYRTRGAFQAKNAELLAEVARLRDKARRSDMMADDGALLAVFDRAGRPATSSTERRSRRGARVAEKEDPRVLLLSLEDVLAGDPSLVAARLPRRRHAPRRRRRRDVPLRSVGGRRRHHADGPARPLAAARPGGARLDDPGLAPGEDRRAPPRAAEVGPARARVDPGARRSARRRRSFRSQDR